MGKQAKYLLRVSNISAFATRDQLLTLFSSFGRVEGYKVGSPVVLRACSGSILVASRARFRS